MTDRPLAGRIAFVTGSGRGLGRAMADKLAALGADLAIHDRDSAEPGKYGEAGGISVLEIVLPIPLIVRRTGELERFATVKLTSPAPKRFGDTVRLGPVSPSLEETRVARESLSFDVTVWKLPTVSMTSGLEKRLSQ